ncbi:hypothetical protein ACR79N_15980 [Sphingobacterium siyangense]
MTPIPTNWQSLKKRRGRSAVIMPALRSMPIGMQMAISNYETAKQYKSLLKKEFPERDFEYYKIEETYFLGRIA